MMIPTVHLNGTSAKELAAQYEAAYSAVGEAMRVVAAAAPNGRDYYVQSPTAIGEAMAEHEARLRALQRIRTDMMTLFDAVSQ
jgi:hypothetical protein